MCNWECEEILPATGHAEVNGICMVRRVKRCCVEGR